MERKAVRIVMCIAAILTAVITLWGKETGAQRSCPKRSLSNRSCASAADS